MIEWADTQDSLKSHHDMWDEVSPSSLDEQPFFTARLLKSGHQSQVFLKQNYPIWDIWPFERTIYSQKLGLSSDAKP